MFLAHVLTTIISFCNLFLNNRAKKETDVKWNGTISFSLLHFSKIKKLNLQLGF